jgi:hypothetical protein
VQNSSTKNLFTLAAEGKYGVLPPDHVGASLFPDLIADLTKAYSDWFPLLRVVRTLTTHGETGSCHQDPTTGRISYHHRRGRLGSNHDVIIDDVVAWLDGTYDSVSALIERCFERCFVKLEPIERAVMCGMYNGRVYERMIAPTQRLSSNDGRCLSRGWFETEPSCECPKRDTCDAYTRPVSRDERNAHYAGKKATK